MVWNTRGRGVTVMLVTLDGDRRMVAGPMISSLRTSPVARGLTVLYGSTFLSGLGWSMVLPAIPAVANHFGVSLGAGAQVVTAFAVGRFVGLPIAGFATDRLGTRASMVGGSALVAGSALLAGLAPWFPLVLFALFLVGTGDSIWTMGREISGVDLVRVDQRGRVLSGFHGMHTGGQAFGPLVGGLIIELANLRTMFIVYAAVGAFSVLLAIAANNAHAPHPAEDPSKKPVGFSITARARGFADMFRQIDPGLRRTYAVLVFGTLAAFMFRMTFQSMVPVYADTELGLSPAQIGALFTVSGVLVLAMIVPVGFILDKVGRKWATVPSTGLPALAFILVPFADSFVILAALVGVMGVANGLSLGSLAASTYDVVPASARGRLQAARRTIAELGGVSAPLVGGFLANSYNASVPFLVYAPVLVVAALLLAFVAKETLVKRA